MSVRITFNSEQVGRTFVYGVRRTPERVRTAASATADEAAANIKERAASDISGAGRFGSRWTDSLHADVSADSERVLISVYSTIPYFSVFEFGATIKGQPMLWIPLSPAYGGDAQGIYARDYPGGVFGRNRAGDPIIGRSGSPLLLSRSDRKPVYFGKEQVTIPQKFHIREICRSEAAQLPTIYRTKLAATS